VGYGTLAHSRQSVNRWATKVGHEINMKRYKTDESL